MCLLMQGVGDVMGATEEQTNTADGTISIRIPSNSADFDGNSTLSLPPLWPTIDGSLGLADEQSLSYARTFYKFGFALLPFLWAVNCFYFWPVLRHPRSFPLIRPYVVRSAIGFVIFAAALGSWALTFSIGGEHVFGHAWNNLVMYNAADRLGLAGLM